MTKLEAYLSKHPVARKCDCDSLPTLKMTDVVYIGCNKCNRAFSKTITHQKAQEIQNGTNK